MSGLLGARTCSSPGEASDLKFPLGAKLREPLTQARFQQLFGGVEQAQELLPESRWSGLCRLWRRRARACSVPGAWRLLRARLPPLRWLPQYRWRAWLLGDAVAGVTVGIVHVPQGERPQHQPVRGPGRPRGWEQLGSEVVGSCGWGFGDKFWVRTVELHQSPTPQLPSSAQSFEKSETRSGSGNWREERSTRPAPQVSAGVLDL